MNHDERRKLAESIISPAQAIELMEGIKPGDPESSHMDADVILLAVVPPDVRAAWARAEERDGGWWWA